jgi:hypothetical protein
MIPMTSENPLDTFWTSSLKSRKPVRIARSIPPPRATGLHSRSWGINPANEHGEPGRPFEWPGRSTITKIELFCLQNERILLKGKSS